jgi:Na+/alanine symporter
LLALLVLIAATTVFGVVYFAMTNIHYLRTEKIELKDVAEGAPNEP